MKPVNLATAAVFLLLGAFLVVSSFGFPAGMGRLPGPGFFPAVVGGAILFLASLLAASALRETSAEKPALAGPGRLAVAAALLAAYVLAWGAVPFAARTALFTATFLRLVGQPWRASLTVAVLLTAAVVLAFQYGLRVSLQ